MTKLKSARVGPDRAESATDDRRADGFREVLDSFASLAADACGKPIAAITLLEGQRQRLSGSCGMKARIEMPRDLALFNSTVRTEPIEVSDVKIDPRLASNLNGIGIRFYAGVPITCSDGSRRGTLCVIDRQPGSLSIEQRRTLTAISRTIAVSLEGAQLAESQLAAIVRSSEDAIVGKTVHGVITSWNEGASRIFGYAEEEVLGKSISILFPSDRIDEEVLFMERVLNGESVRHYETVRVRKDRSLVDISVSVSPIRNAAGTIVGVSKIARDMSGRHDLERRLAEEHDRLRVTMESIADAVITTDIDGRVQWMNPAAERLTGWGHEAATGQHITQVCHVVKEEVPVHGSVLIARDGSERAIDESAAPIRDAGGSVVGDILVFRDVSEQRRMTHEMAFRATHDPLTGLVNRAELEVRLQMSLDRSIGEDSQDALMFIDLDEFKLVNDACGHSAGDELLRQIGALLQKAIRAGDVLARVGGDEFCILLEACPIEQARAIAEQICERMDDFRFSHHGRRFRPGASIGVVGIDARWANIAAILRAGDSACYAAKKAGRNRVRVWSDAERSLELHGETEWASQLAEALDEDRFVLYGQQIVPLADADQGLCLEVLLRLRTSDGLIVDAPTFLPAAERFHFASRIDRWVLSTVIQWLESEPRVVHIDTLSINLSGQSVGDRQFHVFAEALLRSVSFDLRKLCFEITETAAIANFADAETFIEQMRGLGVRIALDDFGAGTSAFGYLKKLPVDYLKIDAQFIRDMVNDPLDRAAVRCFHDIAQAVGLKTVAECVENVATVAELRDIGIDKAQGHLFHRAEPLSLLIDRYFSDHPNQGLPGRQHLPVGLSESVAHSGITRADVDADLSQVPP